MHAEPDDRDEAEDERRRADAAAIAAHIAACPPLSREKRDRIAALLARPRRTGAA